MVMDASMYPIPLLQRVAEGLSLEGLGLNILSFDSSEVLILISISIWTLCAKQKSAICVIRCAIIAAYYCF